MVRIFGRRGGAAPGVSEGDRRAGSVDASEREREQGPGVQFSRQSNRYRLRVDLWSSRRSRLKVGSHGALLGSAFWLL